MKKPKEKQIVPIKITFTEGYEERFTKAVLKIYASRLQKEEKQQKIAG